MTAPAGEAAAAAPADDAPTIRPVVRSNGVAPKPLTLEEAEMQIEERDCDQVTFRDAESGRLQVLFPPPRRPPELVDVGA